MKTQNILKGLMVVGLALTTMISTAQTEVPNIQNNYDEKPTEIKESDLEYLAEDPILFTLHNDGNNINVIFSKIGEERGNFKLVELTGKVIIDHNLPPQSYRQNYEKSFHVGNLPSGVYIATVRQGNQVLSKKFYL